MVRMSRRSTGLWRRQRGAVLVVTSFILVGLLGVSAMVVDVVNLHQAQIRAQATVDAAALAAGQDIDDIPAALSVVKDYARRNFGVQVNEWDGCIDPEALFVATALSCVSIDYAADPQFLRVHLPDRTIPTFFGAIFGTDRFAISASATVEAVIQYSNPELGYPDDDDPVTPNLRSGDPGGGFPPCDTIPDWDAGLPGGSTTTTTDPSGTTTTTDPSGTTTTTDGGNKDKKKGDKDGDTIKWSEFIFVYEHTDGTTTTICGTTLPDGGTRRGLPKQAVPALRSRPAWSFTSRALRISQQVGAAKRAR